MLTYQIKDVALTVIYVFAQILILFCVNFYYSDIITYYLFEKFLNYKILYTIKVYEKILTQFYLATIFTFFTLLPFLWYNVYLYLSPGLYKKEKEEIKKKFIKITRNLGVESMICILVILPLLTNNTKINTRETKGIIEITSYSNITEIMGKLIIIWIIMGILIKISNKEKKRKYVPIIILGLSLWVLPPSIKIQGIVTLVVISRLEINIWMDYWIKNKKEVNKVGPRL